LPFSSRLLCVCLLCALRESVSYSILGAPDAAMARTAMIRMAALGVVASGAAGAFLEQGGVERPTDLLEEVERAMGGAKRDDVEGRVAAFEELMRPTFLALPHTKEDRLPSASVRYLLHRAFVERHAWYVEGLVNGGEAWNQTSPAAAFARHGGGEAQGVFESRLASEGGLTLRETAVLASTLESLIHEENVERLRSAFRIMGLGFEASAHTEQQIRQAIDNYMLMFVLGMNHSIVTPQLMDRTWRNIGKVYPEWPETRKWVREVREEVVGQTPDARTSLVSTLRVLEAVASRYGRWQDRECLAMKEDLVRLEKVGTGRVLLRDFYEAALFGGYQFMEKKPFLRQLGVLDESEVAQPSVVIPNYMNAATNCMAGSKFYSVCCMSECEPLLKTLEQRIGAPGALPGAILEIVERLPSSSVDAPRSLDASMVERLEGIAEQHGGKVPLHGRLFAQWMHHAFPRECPYPHISGTTQQMTSSQYLREKGESSALDRDGLLWEVEVHRQGERVADGARRFDLEHDEEVSPRVPWSTEEEVFAHTKEALAPQPPSRWHSFASSAIMLVAGASLLVSAWRASLGPKALLSGKARAKCVV